MIVICFLIFLLQCEFWARQKNKLDKHVQRVHLRQKNFLCEKCDFRGFIQAELDVHVREVCIVLRSDRKKSTHTFLSITQIWIVLVKNHSSQQKVHILRIPNW